MWKLFKSGFFHAVKNDSISLLYFIGRGRTQRQDLACRKIFFMGFAVSFICLLSIFIGFLSLFFINSYGNVLENLRARSEQVITYQSQYENLFEEAYGLVEQKKKNALPAPEKTKQWQKNITSPMFRLSKLTQKVSDDGVNTLEFSLLNISGTQLKGYSWGVANLIREDGVTSYIGVPKEQVLVGADGGIMDLNLANTFSFRKRWNSKLEFSAPENSGTKLASLMIFFADKDGKLMARFSFQPLESSLPDQLSSH